MPSDQTQNCRSDAHGGQSADQGGDDGNAKAGYPLVLRCEGLTRPLAAHLRGVAEMAARRHEPADDTLLRLASTMRDPAYPDDSFAPSTKQEEWRSFLFFTVVMAPVLAVMVVGGYGFLVWMYQLLAGPPGS